MEVNRVPNIEIHGLPQKDAEELGKRIFYLFGDVSYINKMVVTIFPTIVKDVNWQDQPFLRLANSCQKHSKEILKRLETLNIDVEHVGLKKFIPKKKQ